MTADAPVLVRVDDAVAVLSFNRPERLNAWGRDLSEPALDALEELRLDPSVRAVVLTGEGRAFCAGANLKRLANPESTEAAAGEGGSSLPRSVQWRQRDIEERGHPVFDALSHYPKPLIAAVNGYAIGIGCLLPTCCSFAVAGDDAVFSLPQVSLNIFPAYGGTLRLARFVGRGHALNMAMTGRRVDAQEALRMGLVAAVYPRERLVAEAVRVAKRVAAAPGYATRLTRESLDQGYESGLPAAERADHVRSLALRQALDAGRDDAVEPRGS